MSILKTRKYQEESIEAVKDAWKNGLLRPAVVLPTGSGKTVTFANLIADVGVKTLVLVHRDELAKQAADKIRSIAPDLDVGIVKAEQNEVDADVVVGSVQTLFNVNRRNQLQDVELVVVDECFPAGTRVGDKSIEDLQPGDLVPSWDESTGREVQKPVVRLMKKTPSKMVRVFFDDGTHLDCTPNHPILTDRGWLCAGMLSSGESVVSFKHEEARSTVRKLRGDDRSRGSKENELLEDFPESLLHDRVPGCGSEPGAFRTDVEDQSTTRFRAHEEKQPHAGSRVQGKGVPDTSVHGSQTSDSRWKRDADAGSTADSHGSLPGLGVGVCVLPRRRGASETLQAGYSTPRDEDQRGGGWGVPLLSGAPSLRPSEGRATVFRRVDRIQVLESGSDGTYGGVCPDGYVYNIEVADTHTYLVNDGVVVHNCHHYMAPAYLEVLEHFGVFETTRCVGYTATMSRSDTLGLGDLWQDVVYRKDILWGIINGFLVDVRAESISVDGFNLADIARKRGDYQEGKLGDALVSSGAGAVVAEQYLEKAGERQGIVFTPTVDCAKDFLGYFRKVGISSELVVGTTPIEERQEIYDKYRRGDTQLLVSVMALTEGFDMPQAEVAVIARPTMSESLYIQMVGRVLRPHPGKGDALVLDVVGATSGASLCGLVDLSETEVAPTPDESLAEAYERSEKERRSTTKDAITGKVNSRVVQLFKQSSSVWLRTPGNFYFVPTKEGYVFLWPVDDGFKVGITGSQYSMKGGKYLKDEVLELPYAMAWGEQLASEIDPSTSSRSASWRKKREKANQKQRDLARRLKIDYDEGIRKDELSDLIATHFASKIFDKLKRN